MKDFDEVKATGPTKCTYCGMEFPELNNDVVNHENICRNTIESQKKIRAELDLIYGKD